MTRHNGMKIPTRANSDVSRRSSVDIFLDFQEDNHFFSSVVAEELRAVDREIRVRRQQILGTAHAIGQMG